MSDELAEVWRKEFIGLAKLGSVAAIYEKDRFLNREVELRWQGFIMAKRSQPSVVLPKPWASNEGSLTPDLSTWYRADLVNKRPAAAGIKYTIGE